MPHSSVRTLSHDADIKDLTMHPPALPTLPAALAHLPAGVASATMRTGVACGRVARDARRVGVGTRRERALAGPEQLQVLEVSRVAMPPSNTEH